MKTVRITAKTIDAAVEEGLKQLGISREEAVVHVVEQPSSGLFGLIHKKLAAVDISAPDGEPAKEEPKEAAEVPAVEEKPAAVEPEAEPAEEKPEEPKTEEKPEEKPEEPAAPEAKEKKKSEDFVSIRKNRKRQPMKPKNSWKVCSRACTSM